VTEGWPCRLVEGNSLTPQDCDDGDIARWDDCGGDTDTDSGDTGAEAVYWYGGCDSTGVPWLGGGLALLAVRRRQRGSRGTR
jgi:hypothetical protein